MTGREAHFQNNVLVPTGQRTMRVGLLSKLVPDPRVAYVNLIVGLAAEAVVVIVFVVLITRPMGVVYYLLPGVLWLLGGTALVVIFVLPYRGRSLLTVVLTSFMAMLIERLRLSTSVNGEFPHIGVTDVSNDGTLHFASGDVGVLFRVEGQISRSVLPEVADEVNNARRGWLTVRAPSTGEQLITSIGRKDATPMLDYYREVWSKNKKRATDHQMMSAAWAMAQFEYTKNAIHQKDVVINQLLIIRDIDKASLRKTVRAFQDEVSNTGMYAAATLLDSKKHVVQALRPIALNYSDQED